MKMEPSFRIHTHPARAAIIEKESAQTNTYGGPPTLPPHSGGGSLAGGRPGSSIDVLDNQNPTALGMLFDHNFPTTLDVTD